MKKYGTTWILHGLKPTCEDIMKFRTLRLYAAAMLFGAYLVGCGGEVSSTSFSVGGTVATGAAIRSGSVSIIDSTGALVATGTIGTDGKYSVSVPSTAVAPLIVKATFDEQELYSLKTSASSGVANVNQLTNGVVALVTPGGDPSVLVQQAAAGVSISSAEVESAVNKIAAAVKPVSDAITSTGETVGNFLTSEFTANGKGIDKLLDTTKLSLSSVASGSSSVANLGVTFNTSVDIDDASVREPKGLQLTASDTVASISSAVTNITVSASELPVDDLGALYNEFIERMKACYALPGTARGTKGPGSAWTFTISAQKCKDIFVDSNPDNFVDAGFGVGYARFSGLASPDPVEISAASNGILLQNIKRNSTTGLLEGKALINLRAVGSDGNPVNSQLVTKVFTLNGQRVLGAFGDQNTAEFYVNSAIEVVNHPLTDGADDFVKSSYQIFIPSSPPPNSAGVSKTRSDIDYVEIVTPKEKPIYLKPWGTRNNMYICKDQVAKTGCTITAHLVQAIRFLSDAKHAAGEGPWQIRNIRNFMWYSKTTDTSAICPQFAVNGVEGSSGTGTDCPRSDDEIEEQRAGGLWTATYHFTDGSTSKELKYRHPVRAMSQRELIASTGPDAKAAKLTSATLSRFVGYSEAAVSDGRAGPYWVSDATTKAPIWSPATGGYQFDWTVDAGQIAPRKLYAIGYIHYHDPSNPTGVTWSSAYENNRQHVFVNDSDTYTASDNTEWWYPKLRPSWDESLSFRASTRSIDVTCSKASGGSVDLSCAGSSGGTWGTTSGVVTKKTDRTTTTITGIRNLDTTNAISGAGPNFARGSWMLYANLWTKDEEGRNLTRGYNFHNPY
jgi:hypothetical protein